MTEQTKNNASSIFDDPYWYNIRFHKVNDKLVKSKPLDRLKTSDAGKGNTH